ncbi:SMEK domain-containing protein [Clostridium gasigenes]|uniref:ABC-three component system protein n=1 Tax=Clostridium gasigenes TaxID=94869 RepID=UPI001C0C13F1|nr:ABC-three component system protein [Clostridium gasigenes]MBU3087159.1 SMEK domain-containing protein [Clostridium gasigenes]
MNRSNYYNYIEEKLTVLAWKINQRGKLNILDLNIHSENFYAELFNIVFNLNLANMNGIKQNVEGIDLLDNTNKIIAQVSSTSTKNKIESSLNKKILLEFTEYRFKFISIAKDASNLKNKTFENPYSILFNPLEDIIDINVILKNIINKSIEEQKNIFEFIKKELGTEVDIVKMDSNLTAIINILSLEALSDVSEGFETNSFEIEKKIKYNDLRSAKMIIDDYKVYCYKLDEKYKEFDKQGANKSFTVLQTVRKQYIMLKDDFKDKDEIFYKIMDNIMEIIKGSKNFIEISYEELETYVGILVVDAFIRCKIFENPEGYSYVIA